MSNERSKISSTGRGLLELQKKSQPHTHTHTPPFFLHVRVPGPVLVLLAKRIQALLEQSRQVVGQMVAASKADNGFLIQRNDQCHELVGHAAQLCLLVLAARAIQVPQRLVHVEMHHTLLVGQKIEVHLAQSAQLALELGGTLELRKSV